MLSLSYIPYLRDIGFSGSASSYCSFQQEEANRKQEGKRAQRGFLYTKPKDCCKEGFFNETTQRGLQRGSSIKDPLYCRTSSYLQAHPTRKMMTRNPKP